jgi:hypothetical protein
VFVDTEGLCATVGALRTAFLNAETATVTAPSLSHGGASETLAVLATLADQLPGAVATNLELVARLATVGARDAVTADSCPADAP